MGCTDGLWQSPDGRSIACGSHDGTVTTFDAMTGAMTNKLEGTSSLSLSVEESGTRVARTAVCVFIPQRHRTVCAGHTLPVRSLKYAKNGGNLLYTASDDGRINVYDTYVVTVPCRGGNMSLAVAVGCGRDVCWVWWSVVCSSSRESHSASLVQSLVGHTSWVLAVDSSPDGIHIATGYVPRSLPAPRSLGCVSVRADVCWLVRYSASARSSDRHVKVWDVRKKECVFTFDTHSDQV